MTPSDLIKLKAVIKDMSDTQTKIEFHQVTIKEAKKALKEDLELTSPQINTLLKLYHTQKSDEYFDEQSDLEELFDSMSNAKDA
jgi:hypothetical protein